MIKPCLYLGIQVFQNMIKPCFYLGIQVFQNDDKNMFISRYPSIPEQR